MTNQITRPQIREVFLRNGATIPADSDDLPDYVYESVFELLEMAAPAGQGEQWLTMSTAPKDGTLVRLLVEFDEHATEDQEGSSPTIGHNSFDNTGEDQWQFAGWCWSHDHYTEGKGTPVGWMPMLAAAPAVQGEPAGYVRPHQLEALRSGKACGITLEDKPDAHNRVTIPLYAAPQPAEQQPAIQRKYKDWTVVRQSESAVSIVHGANYVTFSEGESDKRMPWLVDFLSSLLAGDDPITEAAPEDLWAKQEAELAAGQDAPDVAGLVEALDRIASLPMNPCSTENDYRLSAAKAIAFAAVREYRKQGGE